MGEQHCDPCFEFIKCFRKKTKEKQSLQTSSVRVVTGFAGELPVVSYLGKIL